MINIVGCYSIPDTDNSLYPEWVHDHNITILNEGKLIWFLHLERFSRIKYDSSLKDRFEAISKKLKLVPAKDTVFVFVDHEVGRSFISDSGKIRLEASISDQLSIRPEKARLYWFSEWPEAYVINHELAHIYSCIPFYGNFKDNSLLIHFDGGASLSNFSAWRYDNGNLTFIEAHYKYKWISSLFNANALVFAIVNTKKNEQNAVPGKFMGLEAYGSYSSIIEEWLKENNFFCDIWGSKSMFYKSVQKKFNVTLSSIDSKNQLIQDIAATIHEIFLREMLNVFKRLKKETSAEFLYYSGGSALNIKFNARLIKDKLFREIYIPPCTNDSGLSLGAAAAISLLKGIEVERVTPYLNNFQIQYSSDFSVEQGEINRLSDLLIKGGVVGICNGYGEIGPRALGNRSIIARADNTKLSEHISMQMKKREWYRPVAPVMLEKNARYFTGIDELPVISKYMLTEFDILEERKAELQGCVHIDGTSRIQVVFERSDNPFLFDLLSHLDEQYGIRALINTSFNRRGEPIVHTSEHALSAAKEMKLDGVVINGKVKILNEAKF